MKVAVVGCGHVGLTTAACLAHIGHEVLGIDDDHEKVRSIGAGNLPFHEPGLSELVRDGLSTGRLRMSTDAGEAARHGEVVFVCVGTPTTESGAADLRQVEAVAQRLAGELDGYTIVTEKSTVPVETGVWLRGLLEMGAAGGAEFDVASNPEFLQEGRAIRDTLEPDRIVVGADSPRAVQTLRDVYRPILDSTGCEFIATDLATAELIKHASNAFLATKVSFINTVADACERTGADVEVVARAMGLDVRIGPHFLRAGLGFGGECLPKDVRAFAYKLWELGVDAGIMEAVDRVNFARIDGFVGKIEGALGSLEDRPVAMWGLAFKPETDDLRHAPALDVARRLIAAGARVVAHDPVSAAQAKSEVPQMHVVSDPYEAAAGAECVVICTEWPEYATADLDRLRDEMARPLVVDGRNIFSVATMREAGFEYLSIGRPSA